MLSHFISCTKSMSLGVILMNPSHSSPEVYLVCAFDSNPIEQYMKEFCKHVD